MSLFKRQSVSYTRTSASLSKFDCDLTNSPPWIEIAINAGAVDCVYRPKLLAETIYVLASYGLVSMIAKASFEFRILKGMIGPKACSQKSTNEYHHGEE